MGKLAKVMRCASTLALEGSSGCTREIAALTYCNVWNISTFQLKNRSISAEPRLVMDRTCCRPGTLFTASSIGRVTVTIIWSIGITPLSTAIRMRGKLVSGKTEIGMVTARYTPSMAKVRMRKIIDRECRANQYELASLFSRDVRRRSFVIFFRLFAGFRLVRFLGRLCWRPDVHLDVVRQAIGTCDDHFFPGLQSFDDLDVIPLLNANLHPSLMRAAVGADSHYRSASVRCSQ